MEIKDSSSDHKNYLLTHANEFVSKATPRMFQHTGYEFGSKQITVGTANGSSSLGISGFPL